MPAKRTSILIIGSLSLASARSIPFRRQISGIPGSGLLGSGLGLLNGLNGATSGSPLNGLGLKAADPAASASDLISAPVPSASATETEVFPSESAYPTEWAYRASESASASDSGVVPTFTESGAVPSESAEPTVLYKVSSEAPEPSDIPTDLPTSIPTDIPGTELPEPTGTDYPTFKAYASIPASDSVPVADPTESSYPSSLPPLPSESSKVPPVPSGVPTDAPVPSDAPVSTDVPNAPGTGIPPIVPPIGADPAGSGYDFKNMRMNYRDTSSAPIPTPSGNATSLPVAEPTNTSVIADPAPTEDPSGAFPTPPAGGAQPGFPTGEQIADSFDGLEGGDAMPMSGMGGAGLPLPGGIGKTPQSSSSSSDASGASGNGQGDYWAGFPSSPFPSSEESYAAYSSGGPCSTAPVQCCNSVEQHDALTPATLGLFDVLGLSVHDLTAAVGVECNPVTVIGVGSAGCSASPVCCENNQFDGVVALGCTPVNLHV